METEKLYSPLNFYLRDNEVQYDDADYWRDPLSHEEAFAYKDSIDQAILREMEGIDPKQGLAEYIPDSLNDIILSLHPSIELHGNSLWCVANITMTRPITPGEMGELAQWWTGQLSDGWGEGLEQRWINVRAGELYIEPWTWDDKFFIDTQKEFDRRMGILVPQAEDHPLVPDPSSEEAMKQELFDRLDHNLSHNLSHLHGHISRSDLSRDEVFHTAQSIVANRNAHDYLTKDYEFRQGDIESLLRLQNPLSDIAKEWPVGTGLVVVMDAVVHEALDGPEELEASPITDAALIANEQERGGDDGKQSVLAQIRQARESAPSTPAPRKDHPSKDQGPEI